MTDDRGRLAAIIQSSFAEWGDELSAYSAAARANPRTYARFLADKLISNGWNDGARQNEKQELHENPGHRIT